MKTLTEHTLAGVLAARGAPGDATRSEGMARRAAEQATALGMVLPCHPAWLSAHSTRVVAPVPVRVASLRPAPGAWRVSVDNRVSLLPDRVGLLYLAQLVAHPGQECDVVALVGGVTTDPSPTAHALLDAAARRVYRRRAGELRGALARGDLERPATARYTEELTAIHAALRSATRLGGGPRAFPDGHERARTAVRKALMRAVAAIATIEPDLGGHLRSSLTTGSTCCYTPTSGWTLTVRTDDVEHDSVSNLRSG